MFAMIMFVFYQISIDQVIVRNFVFLRMVVHFIVTVVHLLITGFLLMIVFGNPAIMFMSQESTVDNMTV